MTAISTPAALRTSYRTTPSPVVSAAAASAARASEAAPNYVRIYAASIAVVTMLFLVGVGAPVAWYLGDAAAGFGLGAFCAFWGGPSFGVMAASARVSAWFEEHGEHVD